MVGPVAQPAVAVAGDGTIAVFGYVGTGGNWQPVLTRSPDGGQSWVTDTLSAPFSMSAIVGGNFDGSSVGPYQDVAGLARGFAVAFTIGPPVAARPGDTEDVCFVRVPSRRPPLPSPKPPACMNRPL